VKHAMYEMQKEPRPTKRIRVAQPGIEMLKSAIDDIFHYSPHYATS
jgi:hypothetical protein